MIVGGRIAARFSELQFNRTAGEGTVPDRMGGRPELDLGKGTVAVAVLLSLDDVDEG